MQIIFRYICGSLFALTVGSVFASPDIQTAKVKQLVPTPGGHKVCLLVIKKPASSDERSSYPRAIIEMALSKTEQEYGPCQIQVKEAGTNERLLKQVQSGEFDIAWFVSTRERETELLPVRIPVYQGLHGYRLLVIRKSDQSKFDAVKTVDDLKHFIAGQVAGWHFGDVLKFNSLNVDSSGAYDDLYPMLARGRFDYLPRAVHEPVSELKQYSHLALTIEARLMLYHMIPDYFFVKKDATALAERLRLGMERGIADGTRDRIRDKLLNLPALRRDLHLDKRRVIEVKSIEVLEQIPLERKELWLRLH